MNIAIAAAGTGGHVFPGLAVAEALELLGIPRSGIVFMGGDRIEATAVPDAGFELVRFDVRGLVRRPSLKNLGVMAGAARAARQMRDTLSTRQIAVVLAMGGYITGPAAVAARRARIPLLIHEQNAVPGLANRVAARFAQRVLVAFPPAAASLPRAEVVGNPLRASLVADAPAPAVARSRYRLDPGRPVLGILGGSQGADALNQAAHRLVASHPPYQILQLAGPHQHDRWSELAAGVTGWTVVPFEPEMQCFYAAADLVVARSGALTVSELAATGTPSILVPYPGVSSHQEANAAYLAGMGGATVVSQTELGSLADVVRSALEPGELARRGAAALAAGRPDAAGRVAALVREAAGA